MTIFVESHCFVCEFLQNYSEWKNSSEPIPFIASKKYFKLLFKKAL